jgi:hypothetical protein
MPSTTRMLALYRLTSAYHSGQSSRGYRINSRVSHRLHQEGTTPDILDRANRSEILTYEEWDAVIADTRRFGRLRHTL